MARRRATTMPPALLATLLAAALAGSLGACAEADFAPFGRAGTVAAPDSLTVRRVLGQDLEPPPLRPEPGNVWPAAEAPRATLQNPDAATIREPGSTEPLARARARGTPPEPRLQSEAAGPDVPPEAAPNPRNPPPAGMRRGSSTPPGVAGPLTFAPLPRQGVPPGPGAPPPAARQEGRVIPVPGGPPATITGSAGGVSTFTQPGGGVGTAIEGTSTTTLIGPDGSVRVVPR